MYVVDLLFYTIGRYQFQFCWQNYYFFLIYANFGGRKAEENENCAQICDRKEEMKA
jgi:hypothetical protein